MYLTSLINVFREDIEKFASLTTSTATAISTLEKLFAFQVETSRVDLRLLLQVTVDCLSEFGLHCYDIPPLLSAKDKRVEL